MIWNEKTGGRVGIALRGEDIPGFLNGLTAAGIPLLEVDTKKAQKGKVCCYIPLSALRTARSIAKAHDCYITVFHRSGLPYILKEIKHRRLSWLALVGAILLIVAALSFVWRVEVINESGEALKPVEAAELKEAAAKEGILPFAFRGNLRLDDAAEAMLADRPDLAWIGISFHGVTAEIHIVEKTEPAAEEVPCGHIVAKKDGVITSIFVLRGQKEVNVGDTVHKGDILISGYVTYGEEDAARNGETEEGGNIAYQAVAAKGMVEAATWYEGIAYESLEQVKPKPTGRTRGRITATKGSTTITLWGNEENPFEDFTVKKRSCSLRGITLTAVTYREATPIRQKPDRDTARAAAEKKAGAKAQAQIGKTVSVTGRSRQDLTDVPGTVGVRVILETKEDIGKFIRATPPTEEVQ